MKKLILMLSTVLLAIATIPTIARVQKADNIPYHKRNVLYDPGSNEVSDMSIAQFNTDFGKIPDVKWSRSAYFDEATFTKNGKKITAYYDNNSKLVGTTTLKNFADLPANGRKEIKSKYNDYTIGPVIFFKDNQLVDTDMVLYDTQFADADNYFVALQKGTDKIIVQVNPLGDLFFFKKL